MKAVLNLGNGMVEKRWKQTIVKRDLLAQTRMRSRSCQGYTLGEAVHLAVQAAQAAGMQRNGCEGCSGTAAKDAAEGLRDAAERLRRMPKCS